MTNMRRATLIFLLLAACLVGYAADKVMERAVSYPSIDQNNEPVLLSGLLSVPQGKTPRGIILIPHFTISSVAESPSVKPTGEAKAFREDYVLVMPDYIGYGATADRVHPYLAGELTARNTVDMLLSVRPILDSMALGISLDSIYIVGFSQGGAAALWTLRLLEEQYADRIYVRRCFAGSGPYDVASTFDQAVLTNHVTLPLTIPMLILGTSEAYGLNLQVDSLFTPAMVRYNAKYVASKQYKGMQLFFRFPCRKATHWLTPYGMDKSRPETSRFYSGMLRSSLVHYPIDGQASDSICPQWTPRTPVYVFHSTRDDIVSFRNAEHLRRCYASCPSFTWDFGNYGGHYRSVLTFFPRVKRLLEQ